MHPSNYRAEGFTGEVRYRDLARIEALTRASVRRRHRERPLDERAPWDRGRSPDWLTGEPGGARSSPPGADLVLFSGDTVSGDRRRGSSPVDANLVARLAAHPIARAIRIAGPPLKALAATLSLYADNGVRRSRSGGWRASLQAELVRALPPGDHDERHRHGDRRRLDSGSRLGARPSIPGPVDRHPGRATMHAGGCLRADPPIVTRVERDHLIVDPRAIDPEDDTTVARAIAAACR